MLANMPNGIGGRKFGQGLPPVSVILKKLSENGRDSKWKFEKFDKKHEFFQDFSSNFHTWPLYARAKQRSSILQSCAEALRATQKKLWAKKCQKMAKRPILGPKIVILVNKKCFNQKTSAGISSYIIIWWPHAKFEANRMVQLWDRDFCQGFLCVSWRHREGQQDPTRWPKKKRGERPPPT